MTQSDQHQLIQNISQELQNIDPGLDLLNSSSNPSDLNLLEIVTSDQPASEKGQERENEGGDEEGKEGEGEEKKEEGIETEKDEEELETERERDLEREIESNLQSFIQSLTYHQSQSQPQSEHDSQTEAHLDSLSILSELASNVLPVETHSNSHLPEDQTFHSLLLGTLPQDSQALSSSNDQQHDQFHSIDQHRHAQDLLSALSVLQTHDHAFDPHHSSSLTFDSIFNPSSNPTHKLHQIQFSNSFSSSSSSGNTPRTDLPSATSLDQNHPSAFLDQSTQSDLDTLLFGLSTPSIVDQHQHQNHTDGFDDILLASIDQHLLAQDLSLDMIDNETELALESNEAYSNQIRVLLDQLNLALERGEELESLATHYANTIQQQILTSQSQSQSPSQSQSQSQSQSIPTSSTNNNSEVNMVIFAEGSRTVSLPWFKYKFGQDVPVHEDGTKRDRYNSILHQQAWQVGERRKLEEEIILQVKRIKISRERGSNQLTPTVEDVIKYSDQVDWNSISQALPDRSPIECRIQWNQKQNPNLNRTKWQTDEIDKLFEIVKRNEEKDWKSIANQLGTRRTAAECVKQYRMVTQERKEWNENDDLLLKEGVSMYGQNWQAVANHCGRSSNQCINRWSKTLRPDIKKGKWDANEDEALRNAVAACGMVWKDVAPRVRGRTDAQCRERWCNILDPRIVVGNWTAEEDEKILRLRNQESKTWSEISKSFNGRRTDNHCMRRYSELTKSDPKRKQKNVKSHPSKFSRVIQLNPTGTHKNSLIDRIQPELLLASSSSHHHHSSSNSSNSHHLNSHKNKALISSRSCSCSSHVSCSHKSSNPLGLGLGLGHGPSTGLKRVRDLVGEEGMKGSVLKKTR